MSLLGIYEDFDKVTRKSLLHAAAEAGVNLREEAVSSIMAAYYELPRSRMIHLDRLPALTTDNPISVTRTSHPPGRSSPK